MVQKFSFCLHKINLQEKSYATRHLQALHIYIFSFTKSVFLRCGSFFFWLPSDLPFEFIHSYQFPAGNERNDGKESCMSTHKLLCSHSKMENTITDSTVSSSIPGNI